MFFYSDLIYTARSEVLYKPIRFYGTKAHLINKILENLKGTFDYFFTGKQYGRPLQYILY